MWLASWTAEHVPDAWARAGLGKIVHFSGGVVEAGFVPFPGGLIDARTRHSREGGKPAAPRSDQALRYASGPSVSPSTSICDTALDSRLRGKDAAGMVMHC